MYKKLLSLAVATALVSPNAMATSVEDKIELLQQEIETLKDQVAQSDTKNHSSGIQSFVDRTTIGGYGNLNYNNYSGGATANDKIDLQRFVLFFGHKFNDAVSFKSELEIEHAVASSDDAGEAEVEQAYLDFHFNDKVNAKVGLFLIPMGMLNESHEPPTFFGVERNEVETRIIPTTFREAGIGVYGEVLPSLNYQLNLTTTFNIKKFDDPLFGIASAHQEGQLADAEDFAVSGALNYTGITGLLVGSAIYTGNTGQGDHAIGNARLTLWDVHTRYQVGRLDMRALYAHGHLDDAANIKTVTGFDAPESFYGWFTEAAYHVWKSGDMDFAPFVRYESYDTQAKLPAGSFRVVGSQNRVWTVGASYWPDAQVVFKADYQTYDRQDDDKGDRRVNLGMGYMF